MMVMMRKKGTLIHCWWECKCSSVTVKSSIEVPQKPKNRTTMWSSNPTARYNQNKGKQCIQEISALSCLLQHYLQKGRFGSNLYPGNRWINKENVVHVHNGVLFSHKENEILSFAITWMELEDIMLSDVSQAEKDTLCIFSLICGR